MLGSRVVLSRKSKNEAEKPFWISFADLMTALMMLFLVVMSVALLAVTKTVNEAEQRKVVREKDIEQLLDKVAEAAKRYPGVTVDRDRNVINFGTKAQFDTGSHQLGPDKARALRAFVPEILVIARNNLGKRWLKRIVVEGFADQRGSYLMNLNLSLERSQRVLCVMLAPPYQDEKAMSDDEKEQIRDLFLVGGYSFNSAKASFDESRRIELRLEFFGVDEQRLATEGIPRGDVGSCSWRGT